MGAEGIRSGVDHRGWVPPDRVERSGRTERCASESGEVRVTGTLSGDRRQVLDQPGVGAGSDSMSETPRAHWVQLIVQMVTLQVSNC